MRAFHPPIAAGADRPVADPGGDPLWRGQGASSSAAAHGRRRAGHPSFPRYARQRRGRPGQARP